MFEQGIALGVNADGKAVEKALDHEGRVRHFIALVESAAQAHQTIEARRIRAISRTPIHGEGGGGIRFAESELPERASSHR